MNRTDVELTKNGDIKLLVTSDKGEGDITLSFKLIRVRELVNKLQRALAIQEDIELNRETQAVGYILPSHPERDDDDFDMDDNVSTIEVYLAFIQDYEDDIRDIKGKLADKEECINYWKSLIERYR